MESKIYPKWLKVFSNHQMQYENEAKYFPEKEQSKLVKSHYHLTMNLEYFHVIHLLIWTWNISQSEKNGEATKSKMDRIEWRDNEVLFRLSRVKTMLLVPWSRCGLLAWQI